jgi:hypothetical protein
LSAQSHVSFAYAIGFGTGDLGDYISKPSFRGITFDYRHKINPNVALGVNFGWNVFYEEKAEATYTDDNASLTGKQYRYTNSFPMLATATYFLKPDATLNPFATMGIGTVYNKRRTDMNLYSWEQDAWNFALQPEVGFVYQMAPDAGVSVSLKYYHGFQAGNDLPSAQSFLTLNLGFAFF